MKIIFGTGEGLSKDTELVFRKFPRKWWNSAKIHALQFGFQYPSSYIYECEEVYYKLKLLLKNHPDRVKKLYELFPTLFRQIEESEPKSETKTEQKEG